MTNAGLLAAYDADGEIVGPTIFAANPEKEHAGQCVAVETLRRLLELGRTKREWNDMPAVAWQGLALAAGRRSEHSFDDPEDVMAAASIGGAYFEQGYQKLIDGTGRRLVRFTRTGGIRG